MRILALIFAACAFWNCNQPTDATSTFKATEMSALEYSRIDTTNLWVGLQFCEPVRKFSIDSLGAMEDFDFSEFIFVSSEKCPKDGAGFVPLNILIGLDKKAKGEYFCFDKKTELPKPACGEARIFRITK